MYKNKIILNLKKNKMKLSSAKKSGRSFVITPDDVYTIQPKNGKYFSLEEIKSVVIGDNGGNYLEWVYLKNPRKVMIINHKPLHWNFIDIKEEERLKNVPVNELATQILKNNEYNHTIRGNVLMCRYDEINSNKILNNIWI